MTNYYAKVDEKGDMTVRPHPIPGAQYGPFFARDLEHATVTMLFKRLGEENANSTTTQ